MLPTYRAKNKLVDKIVIYPLLCTLKCTCEFFSCKYLVQERGVFFLFFFYECHYKLLKMSLQITMFLD
jgi:hypothetical protein